MRWLDLVPLAWLALVGWAYSRVAGFPMVPTREEVPGVAAADAAVLPLLAALLAAGIIRYFGLRGGRRAGNGRSSRREVSEHNP